MKPLKFVVPIANWLLRFSIAILVYDRFWGTLEKLEIENQSFYFALAMALSTLALLLGGFFKKNTTTILSAFILFGLSFAFIFIGGFTLGKLFENLVPAAISLYFFGRGNAG
jgi:hypothetical protein